MPARLLIVTAFAVLARGADFPPPRTGDGLGVCVHLTAGRERDLERIAAAGVRIVRTDLSWDATERRRAEYDWSADDVLLAHLERHRLRALFILDYSNRWYAPKFVAVDPQTKQSKAEIAAPQTATAIDAFTRWAAAAATHFRGHRVIWEIWNEPNLTFGKPQLDPRAYTKLAIRAARAIHAADPSATVIAPAASGVPLDYLRSAFAAGLLDAIDGVSVHPYRSSAPESIDPEYLALRALIERFVPPTQRRLPIICGEDGYSTYAGGGVSPQLQAAYAVRLQLFDAYNGIPITLWYDWRDDGRVAGEREHHFGLVDADLREKPAYKALYTLGHELTGYRIARRLEVGTDSAWVLLCVDDAGHQKLVVWSSAAPQTVELSVPSLAAGRYTMTNGVDDRATTARAGLLSLPLEADPWYLALPSPVPELAAAAAWQVTNPPTWVKAGMPGAVTFQLKITNPFLQPVRVRINASGLDLVEPQPIAIRLEPHTAIDRLVRGTLWQRATRGMATKLDVEFARANDVGGYDALERSSERLDFVVANPLALAFAPTGEGVRTTVENSSHSSFQVRLLTGGPAPRSYALSDHSPTTLLPPGAQGRVELRDAENRFVLAGRVPVFAPVQFAAFTTSIDGDAQVPATASVRIDPAPPPPAPCSSGWRLDYTFRPGWRFVECHPCVRAGSIRSRPPVPPGVTALGVWVYGDGSQNFLRVRLIDATGQIFQVSGPGVPGREWRWLTFDLSHLSTASHWGGANDGMPHGPLALDACPLIDSTRRGNTGTLHFAGLSWITR